MQQLTNQNQTFLRAAQRCTITDQNEKYQIKYANPENNPKHHNKPRAEKDPTYQGNPHRILKITTKLTQLTMFDHNYKQITDN